MSVHTITRTSRCASLFSTTRIATLALPLLGVLPTACRTEAVSKGGPPVTSANPPVASSPAAATMPSAVADTLSGRDTIRAKIATAAATRVGAAAPARASMSLPLLPARTRHDSLSYVATIRAGERKDEWPVKGPEPLAGSVLPAKRIVAFYGNPLSKRMGVLGEYPVDDMLARLDTVTRHWREADPSTPVQPALHLIAVVAQGDPGRDGMYRLRMPDSLIERVHSWARSRNALLFLDIQVARSTLQVELPRLLPFLEYPDVHLGIDPEFSMHYDKEGLKPGAKIGTMTATDVNYAVRTLAELVAAKQLPPKVLVVHCFTKRMMPNPRAIVLDPRLQVVMNMDGWGPPWLKFDSYRDYVVADPVQFAGFKI